MRYSAIRQRVCFFTILTFCVSIFGIQNFAAAQKDAVEEFQLENGLTVILRPIEKSKKTCYVLIYHFGNLHDRPKQSGVAHFAEHLYVTSATENVKAQSAEEFMKRYAGQWNAQTGDDYTLFAAVFDNDKTGAELTETASRMAKIRITEDDREREVPRIKMEMENMYRRIPRFAAQNAGKAALRPMKTGQRRIGTAESIEKLTVGQLQQFADDFYKPNNATLVLAGGFDAARIKKQITEQFGKIAKGKKPKSLGVGKPKKETVRMSVRNPIRKSAPVVAISISNPLPSDPLYPAFLVLMNRLQKDARSLTRERRAFPVQIVPLDLPYFSSIVIECPEDMTPEKQLEEIESWLAKNLNKEFKKSESRQALQRFGFLLGLTEVPESMHANNPYLLAFQLGRQKQLGYDPEKLAKRFENLDAEQIQKARQRFLSSENRIEVIWKTRKKIDN